jgi:hypothetical protein
VPVLALPPSRSTLPLAVFFGEVSSMDMDMVTGVVVSD